MIAETETSIFVLVLPVAGAMLITWSFVSLCLDLRRNDRKKILERLSGDSARRKQKQLEQGVLRQSKLSASKGYEQLLQKVSFTRAVQKMFDQADIPWSAVRFLVNLAGITAMMFVVTLLIKRTVLVPVIVSFMTFVIPLAVLNFKRKRRINKLAMQLPDVFDLLSQALRAGHSLGSGVQLIGQQLPDPAGIEFGRVFHEQNLGIKIEDALKHMSDRVDQLDVKLFVTAVLIQRQTGGDLTEVLDKISSVIRDRVKLFGQVKSLTAEGRLSGWVLSALPAMVFAASYVLNRDYASVLLYEKSGQYMLYSAIFFQILGMLMIKKIVDIKV